MPRQLLVVGNWKMNGSRASVDALLGELVGKVPAAGPEVAVCPPYVHIDQALQLCEASPVAVGAQDASHMVSGAYTGEVGGAGWFEFYAGRAHKCCKVGLLFDPFDL